MQTVKEIQSAADAARRAEVNNLISPRFYKTDYTYMDKLNIEPVRAEWDISFATWQSSNPEIIFSAMSSLPPKLLA